MRSGPYGPRASYVEGRGSRRGSLEEVDKLRFSLVWLSLVVAVIERVVPQPELEMQQDRYRHLP